MTGAGMKDIEKASTIEIAPCRMPGVKQTGRLPDDVIDESLRRLGNIAAVLAVVATISIPGHWLYYSAEGIPITPQAVAVRLLIVTVSAAMFFITRSRKLSRPVKSDIGLVYEVLGAGSIGFLEMTVLVDWNIPVGSVSIVVVWILVVRLLVPVTTLQAVIASGLSAAMVPLTVEISTWMGQPPVSQLVFTGLLKTSTFAALLAIIASRTVYRLGTAVSEARELGNYRLEEMLGEGGMGQVWRGSHRMLQRTAAIKLIRRRSNGEDTDGSNLKMLQRFEREAQATALLQSVHTVQVFDFGRTHDDSFYYVMEMLDGIDLETLVARFGPITPRRTVYLLKQACHSLGDAHRNGLIHRDVKPSNIFLCRLGPDFDFIKVLDFGLVKQLEAESITKNQLTIDGVVTGTPAYMAPEVALGDHDVGPHTDIYMLGCVGYWLLTGEMVFEGNSPLAIISQHIETRPIPVSTRSELWVPKELDQLILDCLEKAPDDRPQSIAEVSKRLDAVTFDSPWNQNLAADWWRMHHPTEVSTGHTTSPE